MSLPVFGLLGTLAVTWQPALRWSGPQAVLPSFPRPLQYAAVEPAQRTSSSGAMFGGVVPSVTRNDLRVSFEAPARLQMAMALPKMAMALPKMVIARFAAAFATLLAGIGLRIMRAANSAAAVAERWHAIVDQLVGTMTMPVPSEALPSPRSFRTSLATFSRSRKIIATIVSPQLPPIWMQSAEPAKVATPEWARRQDTKARSISVSTLLSRRVR